MPTLASDTHCVRDFFFDEGCSRIRVGKLPRNLACLSNAAISLRTHARALPPTAPGALTLRR